MKKTISIAKKLIDLPYNEFHINTYFPRLVKQFEKENFGFRKTEGRGPIKLMSDYNSNSGIVTYNQLVSPYRKRNIYLIGKGILFDSGGLDLKRGMNDMTNDKAGAIIAIAVANYCKKNVVAYCPFATNFIQDSLITPGDKIKIGKKLVKITSTDAEGRLILAEALMSLNPKPNDIVITIATLTGACPYAVDTKATAVLSLNNKLAQKYIDASKEVKEYAWQLPMWDYADKFFQKKEIVNYDKRIKADTMGGALFLKQFVKYPTQWLHLDIATSAFSENGKANGVPIKSLINFIKKIQ
jgi:leucyl aminopeptidase